MPLRLVHVTFIGAAAIMSAGVALWSATAWRQGGEAGWLMLTLLAAAGSVALVVYGGRFLRKMRGLGLAALVTAFSLATPGSALACPACVGTTDSPLRTGMNLGILTLVGVITVVLACFGAFFIQLARRSRRTAGLMPRQEGA